MGVFHFEYDGEFRYRRTGAPTDPLLADRLPSPLREYLTLVHLPAIDFSATAEPDLEGQVLCIAYGDNFWSSTGVRTVSGSARPIRRIPLR